MNADAFSALKFAALIFPKSLSFSSSENPASSTAFRPALPPSKSASSVASARRLDIAPSSGSASGKADFVPFAAPVVLLSSSLRSFTFSAPCGLRSGDN